MLTSEATPTLRVPAHARALALPPHFFLGTLLIQAHWRCLPPGPPGVPGQPALYTGFALSQLEVLVVFCRSHYPGLEESEPQVLTAFVVCNISVSTF